MEAFIYWIGWGVCVSAVLFAIAFVGLLIVGQFWPEEPNMHHVKAASGDRSVDRPAGH